LTMREPATPAHERHATRSSPKFRDYSVSSAELAIKNLATKFGCDCCGCAICAWIGYFRPPWRA